MNAMDFYQLSTDTDKPIALILLTKETLGQGQLSPIIQQTLQIQQFKGNLGDVAIIGEEGIVTEVYIGQGTHEDREAIAYAVLKLPEGCYLPRTPLSMRASVIWSLGQYRFTHYKKREILMRRLILSCDQYEAIAPEVTSIFLTRDLINTPANELHPEALIFALKELAEKHQGQFEQRVGSELLQHNFPAVYTVGKAGSVEPRIAFLRYGDPTHPRVTIVGKGVCFDSGGLDIKPSSNMRLMKKDMGGAAIAIGLGKWLMMKKLPIHLTVIIPAVENAISADAYRPGDVITMRNGLTVEIDNTDAEGRLILADALAYACEQKPELLIDFATLTGAARVAVGTEISAVFTQEDSIAQALFESSQKMKDPVWRLPLYKGYTSMFDSNIADLSNSTSSSYAGAITAALFLERFINSEVSWIHFDTMAWNISAKPGRPEGGEAMSLQAVADFLIQKYSDKD